TGWINEGVSSDYLTIKYTSALLSTWEKTYDGNGADQGRAIAADGTGIYVTGISSGEGNDYFTLKYGADGSIIWFARYSAGVQNDRGLAITVDPTTEDVYVTGTSASDYMTLRYKQKYN
ncbi:hypothetical protein ACFLT9_06870, partial [Acidobacteriota bacterium]